jgi:hypothetical protein
LSKPVEKSPLVEPVETQRELWASLVSTGSTSGMALGVAGFDRLNQR